MNVAPLAAGRYCYNFQSRFLLPLQVRLLGLFIGVGLELQFGRTHACAGSSVMREAIQTKKEGRTGRMVRWWDGAALECVFTLWYCFVVLEKEGTKRAGGGGGPRVQQDERENFHWRGRPFLKQMENAGCFVSESCDGCLVVCCNL